MTKRILSLAAAVFLMSGTAQAANLIIDGDFVNAPTSGGYTTYTSVSSFGPWNVTSGSVDLINTYWQSPSAVPNGGSVDMDGLSPGTITQNFVAPAGNYALTFDLSGNPDGQPSTKTLQVTVGSVTQTYTYTIGTNSHGNMQYAPETLDFTSPGGGLTLTFASLDTNSPYGPVVGDVSVLSATPLPAALVLFGSGLFGLFLVARRRLAKA